MAGSPRKNSLVQQLQDATVHDWYRFVLSFPSDLILESSLQAGHILWSRPAKASTPCGVRPVVQSPIPRPWRYVSDNDSAHVADVPEIQAVAREVERQRLRYGATSGFERLYHRVVTEYFGGMYRVLEQLEQVMPAGSQLALVVGDQMSYFQVPIRTARLLSLVACQKLHYEEVETLTWRTRRATATKMDLAEHILILRRR